MSAAPDWSLLDRAPAWLPGGHLQTIWPALAARAWTTTPPRWRRERWTTPDGDFVDADWLVEATARDQGDLAAASPPRADRPLLVVFHGLEGSSRSAYALALADRARQLGWACVVPHFRGCSGEINRAPRAYHSGDFAEIGWMLGQARTRHLPGSSGAAGAPGVVHALGVSLGGNALLRWAEEAGATAREMVASVTAVCAPIDLMASGLAIGRGANRLFYTPHFLRTMKPKALAKLAQFPGLFDAARLRAARTLWDFDDVFTGPLHGFDGVADYWTRASALPHLGDIRVPTRVINARNDPFVPIAELPAAGRLGPWVELLQPRAGGHCGFAAGTWPGHVLTLPQLATQWMQSQA